MLLCYNVKMLLWLNIQVELSKFVADHDFCLEIKYEEQHQPHVIIEKADSEKGMFHGAYTPLWVWTKLLGYTTLSV